MTSLPLNARSRARVSLLYDELAFALSRLERDALKAWGGRSAARLLMLAGRRVGGVAKLAALFGRAGLGEAIGVLSAYRQRRLSTHVGDRAAAAIDGTLALGCDSTRLIAGAARALIRDPRAAAPAVLGGLLGLSGGSGAPARKGDIPDLSLLAGIGTRRAPAIYPLLAGIVAEGMLLALADLAAEVHGKLPRGHDPLWDGLARVGRPLTKSLAIGTSADLAYQLLVEALLQPGARRGLAARTPPEARPAAVAGSRPSGPATDAKYRRRGSSARRAV